MSKTIFRIYINYKGLQKSFIYDKEDQLFVTPTNWQGSELVLDETELNEHLEVIKSNYKNEIIQVKSWEFNPYTGDKNLIKEYKLSI